LLTGLTPKAQAILDGGGKWEDGVLRYSDPESLTHEEQAFVDERITEWKYRILKRG
jgi:hypothetical protein